MFIELRRKKTIKRRRSFSLCAPWGVCNIIEHYTITFHSKWEAIPLVSKGTKATMSNKPSKHIGSNNTTIGGGGNDGSTNGSTNSATVMLTSTTSFSLLKYFDKKWSPSTSPPPWLLLLLLLKQSSFLFSIKPKTKNQNFLTKFISFTDEVHRPKTTPIYMTF